MSNHLTDVETRILGCLVEKQLTTPEYYPLTLNSLASACNQKSNRDPVVSYDETTLLKAIDDLRDKNLVYLYYGSNSRTVKYKHMLPSVYQLNDAETALVAVLFLRGPQTVGELRERTGRLYEFGNIAETQEALDQLATRSEPVIARLERLPGQKDPRYAHLLSGEIDIEAINAAREAAKPGAQSESKVQELESEIAELKENLSAFRAEFEEFKKQFD